MTKSHVLFICDKNFCLSTETPPVASKAKNRFLPEEMNKKTRTFKLALNSI